MDVKKAEIGEVLLKVTGLKTYFKINENLTVKAVDGVTFSLKKGHVLGIIGESGSGKSVTSRSIMRIVDEPGYIAGGTIEFGGEDILKVSEKRMSEIRGGEISMIFQELCRKAVQSRGELVRLCLQQRRLSTLRS